MKSGVCRADVSWVRHERLVEGGARGAQHENTQFGSRGQGRGGEDGLSDIYRKKSGAG